MLSGITLPTIDEISDKNNAEKIRGYLATLHDQLRYMMLNIDTANLSDGLSSTISTAADNAEQSKQGVSQLKESMVKMGDSLSRVTQTADKINWLISDGGTSTDFTLTPSAASVISESINISGYVKITDLAQSGTTLIDGGNIKSGTISADKLSVSDMSALTASVGGWTISDSSISSSASGYGSLSLNSASSSDYYWLRATNAAGYTTFYIAKNGNCYLNGGFISEGSITAGKIVCDSEKRLDLTNNYNGIKIGSGMVITNGAVNCRVFVNTSGVLTFDTGRGDSMFSFALTRSGSAYSLAVLNGSGQTVGTIPLQ